MHFVSFKDTPSVDYIDFYRSKFPQAFMTMPEDSEDDAQPEWRSKDHEKQFKSFEKDMAKIAKEKNCLNLISLLSGFKKQVLELPTSAKQAECTIQRFYLYLLPCVNMAHQQDAAKTMDIFVQFIDLLAKSEFGLSSKITSLLHAYNAMQNGLKAHVFKTLVNLCQKEGQLEILVQRARNVEQESALWKLTDDERKDLYLSVAQALDAANDEGAFQVLHAYLRQFESDKTPIASVEAQARRCVILAIKAPSVINFEELLDLKTIKALESKQQEVFKFLSLFTQTDAKNFKSAMSAFSKLMKDEGLTSEEVILKKSYVQICSLSTDKTNFKYADLATLLNVDTDDVEEWAIEAISKRIIDAKIDQQNQEIVIKSHQLREIKTHEWKQIQNKVRVWKEKFQRMYTVLEASGQMAAKVQAK